MLHPSKHFQLDRLVIPVHVRTSTGTKKVAATSVLDDSTGLVLDYIQNSRIANPVVFTKICSLIQPASRQFRPLFYGGAGRAKSPPHPSSGGRERPRGAQHHGRRAGERLPPDDVLQATSSHHIKLPISIRKPYLFQSRPQRDCAQTARTSESSGVLQRPARPVFVHQYNERQ